ncbi:MAG: RIP metalloprotease RseP [Oligoflexia bacterium]|nr:RIP metalloprotease RseP [Oligoflexia bacterium]
MLDFLVALAVLGILIFVHELGHFLLAKWNGIGVVEFSIGFGRKIFSRRIGETQYSIGLIPLGGYVRMLGDDPRDLTVAPGAEVALDGTQYSQDELAMRKDRSRWFLAKGYWPKFSVVLAGPAFNILFAIIASCSSFYAYGRLKTLDVPVIGDVLPGYPAEKAGLKPKDRVVTIDGKQVATWKEMAELISASQGQEMLIKVSRPATEGANPQDLEIMLSGTNDTADLAVVEGNLGKRPFKVGIVPDSERAEVGLLDAIGYGSMHVLFLCRVTVDGLLGMVQGLISPKHISGPIFIFKEAARSANRGLEHVLEFMVFLSVSLAILNLLPIPILDGGHLMFFTIEALRGAPLSLRVQELANQVGMLILFALMIFAFGNDLLKL